MRIKLFSILIFFLLFIFYFGLCLANNEFFQRGLRYYQEGEFQIAVAHLEEAKKASPREPLIYFYLGNSYYELKDVDSAILNFTAGLNFTDKKGVYFYNLGNCYFLKGNYDFAAEMYAKASQNDPTLYDSYLNAGNAFYKKGDIPKTIVQWETYLTVYPETPQYVKIERAIAYLKGELVAAADEQTAQRKLEEDLLSEVLSDLEELINRTENVMESSEAPIDDLRSEEIER
jgi:tetratricopeptide (TPR) repeat protein